MAAQRQWLLRWLVPAFEALLQPLRRLLGRLLAVHDVGRRDPGLILQVGRAARQELVGRAQRRLNADDAQHADQDEREAEVDRCLEQVQEGLQPGIPEHGNAYKRPFSLPGSLSEALDRLERSDRLKALLGDRFVKIYTAMKRQEYQAYFEVISPWEREYLLLNV